MYMCFSSSALIFFRCHMVVHIKRLHTLLSRLLIKAHAPVFLSVTNGVKHSTWPDFSCAKKKDVQSESHWVASVRLWDRFNSFYQNMLNWRSGRKTAVLGSVTLKKALNSQQTSQLISKVLNNISLAPIRPSFLKVNIRDADESLH